MKIIVIGSGIAGLTAAATLAQAGHQVELFEQNDRLGGVTAGFEKDGFRWDLGQLLLEGLGPDEPAGRILNQLGILNRIRVVKDDRGYVFSDFELRKPPQVQGPRWRIDRLKQIFPDEPEGLERYWSEFVRFNRVMTAGRRMENASGFRRLAWNAKLYWNLLPLLKKKNWSAQQLMDDFFHSPQLKLVFISILADFFTSPSQFMGLGVYMLNPEVVYDCRLPSEIMPGAEQVYQYSILGGANQLVQAFAAQITQDGGIIHTNCPVVKILTENGRVKGILDGMGNACTADMVVASGGARETFLGLVGADQLPAEFCRNIGQMALMDSVFMIHLGVDYDPRPHAHGTCTYFYNTSDLDAAIDIAHQGIFHEGRDGFVVHIPSFQSPAMAPEGLHAMTIYTIAPDRLSNSSWSERKEEFAAQMLLHAEQRLPGLRQHIRSQVVLTPDDFRKITFTDHHAFGGIAPVMGRWRPPYQTPIKGLWFVGAQSESGGGVGSVMLGAYQTARKISASK